MSIRQLHSFSQHLRPTTPGRCGAMWQSIVCVLSQLWISATPTKKRYAIGNRLEKNCARKNQKVLLSLRAVRGRGIARFESFCKIIGLLLGSGR